MQTIYHKNQVTVKKLENEKLLVNIGSSTHMIYKDHRGYVIDKCCENAERYEGLIINVHTNIRSAVKDLFKAESWYRN